MSKELRRILNKIPNCNRCKRLRHHCTKIAREKRKAYLNETYWGKPVQPFGDPKARLIIIGLAPAAHGANRTGRMFTGDRSGEWLYRALYEAKFSNQMESVSRDDPLRLKDVYISAVAKCAPPLNKPTPREIRNCAPYLESELRELKNARVFLALGQIALNGVWPFISEKGEKKPKFAHGKWIELESGKFLLMSYHPSQQNTFTKRLTKPMFDSVFRKARNLIGSRPTRRYTRDTHAGSPTRHYTRETYTGSPTRRRAKSQRAPHRSNAHRAHRAPSDL